MQHIKDVIRIKVFIAKNPLTKSEWLIIRYGEASALFCVIRLDPTFVISRYSIQRLLLNIDNDQEHNALQQEVKLKELQLEHGPVGPYIHQQSITEEYPSKNGDKNLAKPFDFLGQVSFQARPVTVLMLRVQPLLRNINQRIQNQPGRLRIRRRQLNAQINNEDTIYRLTNLPQQPITNNPFIDSFFQGTSFQ
ncbi:unnamed protein product [Rhizophagus irregularis]|nr:unnamed protein product [Rhizophagus irregularis]